MSKSPTPRVIKRYSFYDALEELAAGAKITKLEWENVDIYGVMMDGRVKLHKEDNKFYEWIITDGDMAGDDWVVI